MTKSQIRESFLSLRKNLDSNTKDELSLAVFQQVLQLDIWHHQVFHLFLPIESQNEINTYPLLDFLVGLNKKILLPKVQGTTLLHLPFKGYDHLELSPLNIPEPVGGGAVDATRLEVLFIPLIAFDMLGYRVGYGKGFYDRFLQECQSKALKIGLSLFEPLDVIEDIQRWDMKLDKAITPERIFSF